MHASLVDLLCDGDTALIDRARNVNRRAYRVKWLAGGWVITLPEQWKGPAAGWPGIEEEGAERENQAYLASLGWLR